MMFFIVALTTSLHQLTVAHKLVCVNGSEATGSPCLAIGLRNCVANGIILGTTKADLTWCRRSLHVIECSCGTADDLNDTNVYEKCYDRFRDFIFDNGYCRNVEIPKALMDQLDPRRTATTEGVESTSVDSTADPSIDGPQLRFGLPPDERYLLRNATIRMFIVSILMATTLIIQLLFLSIVRRRLRKYHMLLGPEPATQLPSEENKTLSIRGRLSTYSNYSIIQSFEKAFGLAYSGEQDMSADTGGVQDMPYESKSREEPEEHLESAIGLLEKPFPVEPKYGTNFVNTKGATAKATQQPNVGRKPVNAPRLPY
ncbi:hypothetical protein Aduo_011246 [Ancylostoma duodenale]